MFLPILLLLLPLGGCIGVTGLMVLEGLASAATLADRVLDIDISLTQTRPDKAQVAPPIRPGQAPAILP